MDLSVRKRRHPEELTSPMSSSNQETLSREHVAAPACHQGMPDLSALRPRHRRKGIPVKMTLSNRTTVYPLYKETGIEQRVPRPCAESQRMPQRRVEQLPPHVSSNQHLLQGYIDTHDVTRGNQHNVSEKFEASAPEQRENQRRKDTPTYGYHGSQNTQSILSGTKEVAQKLLDDQSHRQPISYLNTKTKVISSKKRRESGRICDQGIHSRRQPLPQTLGPQSASLPPPTLHNIHQPSQTPPALHIDLSQPSPPSLTLPIDLSKPSPPPSTFQTQISQSSRPTLHNDPPQPSSTLPILPIDLSQPSMFQTPSTLRNIPQPFQTPPTLPIILPQPPSTSTTHHIDTSRSSTHSLPPRNNPPESMPPPLPPILQNHPAHSPSPSSALPIDLSRPSTPLSTLHNDNPQSSPHPPILHNSPFQSYPPAPQSTFHWDPPKSYPPNQYKTAYQSSPTTIHNNPPQSSLPTLQNNPPKSLLPTIHNNTYQPSPTIIHNNPPQFLTFPPSQYNNTLQIFPPPLSFPRHSHPPKSSPSTLQNIHPQFSLPTIQNNSSHSSLPTIQNNSSHSSLPTIHNDSSHSSRPTLRKNPPKSLLPTIHNEPPQSSTFPPNQYNNVLQSSPPPPPSTLHRNPSKSSSFTLQNNPPESSLPILHNNPHQSSPLTLHNNPSQSSTFQPNQYNNVLQSSPPPPPPTLHCNPPKPSPSTIHNNPFHSSPPTLQSALHCDPSKFSPPNKHNTHQYSHPTLHSEPPQPASSPPTLQALPPRTSHPTSATVSSSSLPSRTLQENASQESTTTSQSDDMFSFSESCETLHNITWEVVWETSPKPDSRASQTDSNISITGTESREESGSGPNSLTLQDAQIHSEDKTEISSSKIGLTLSDVGKSPTMPGRAGDNDQSTSGYDSKESYKTAHENELPKNIPTSKTDNQIPSTSGVNIYTTSEPRVSLDASAGTITRSSTRCDHLTTNSWCQEKRCRKNSGSGQTCKKVQRQGTLASRVLRLEREHEKLLEDSSLMWMGLEELRKQLYNLSRTRTEPSEESSGPPCLSPQEIIHPLEDKSGCSPPNNDVAPSDVRKSPTMSRGTSDDNKLSTLSHNGEMCSSKADNDNPSTTSSSTPSSTQDDKRCSTSGLNGCMTPESTAGCVVSPNAGINANSHNISSRADSDIPETRTEGSSGEPPVLSPQDIHFHTGDKPESWFPTKKNTTSIGDVRKLPTRSGLDGDDLKLSASPFAGHMASGQRTNRDTRVGIGSRLSKMYVHLKQPRNRQNESSQRSNKKKQRRTLDSRVLRLEQEYEQMLKDNSLLNEEVAGLWIEVRHISRTRAEPSEKSSNGLIFLNPQVPHFNPDDNVDHWSKIIEPVLDAVRKPPTTSHKDADNKEQSTVIFNGEIFMNRDDNYSLTRLQSQKTTPS
ncbi:flocculation protein FLO11 [Aplysia californica]|uniref:Flocculation protein FLO11 n=1 Tax=Aplysia californica TaxID=6500 RepID=A0ABM0JY36_APLCA|nr:flocculation protein FLO11 [Aplysia californica]